MKCARCFKPLEEEVANNLKVIAEEIKKELIYWGIISSELKKLEVKIFCPPCTGGKKA